MAFEVPLEADRVDDLNLFSTLVRAPVVGTLMWVLGGHNKKAKDDDEEENNSPRLVPAKQEEMSSTLPRTGNFRRKLPSALKKGIPRAGSEVSGLLSDSLEGMHLVESNGQLNPFKRQKKALSWSDESGHSLVEYAGENKVRTDKERENDDRGGSVLRVSTVWVSPWSCRSPGRPRQVCPVSATSMHGYIRVCSARRVMKTVDLWFRISQRSA